MAKKKQQTKSSSNKRKKMQIQAHNNSSKPATNRTYKDSLFTDLFYSDITAEENLRNLYHRKYETELIPIPTPEFYIFYNGKASWDVKELRLSDAFKDKTNPFNLELKAALINIRAENNSDILQRCSILNQYSKFVQAYESNKGSSDRMGDTIKYCVEHDILKEYIERKGKEVLSMLTLDWDYEEALEIARKESERKGEMQGEIQGVKKGE